MARATDEKRVIKLLDKVWPGHKIEKQGQEHMVECPFCATDKAKLAVNPNKGVFQCWVCGERGPIMKLLEHLKKLHAIKDSDIRAVKTGSKLVKLSDTISAIVTPKPKVEHLWDEHTPCAFPDGVHPLEGFRPRGMIERGNHERVIKYLEGRGLTLRDIFKYRLHFCCKPQSVYHRHVFIPALGTYGREMVFWTTRAVNQKKDAPKSLHSGKKYSRFSAKTILLNEHLVVGTTMAVCEGPFDAWSIMAVTGVPACPLLGKQMHPYHYDVLKQKGVQSVYVCLDADAKKAQAKIARRLTTMGIRPLMVNLEDGDPNDVDPKKLYAAFDKSAYNSDDRVTELVSGFDEY